MYLTRMELDTEKRATRKLLCSRSKIHGMVESAFSGGRERRLWRLDTLGGGLYLLILSEEKPQLALAVLTYGVPEAGFVTKSYDTLLERITAQSRWHFRLVANSTLSKSRASTGKRGQVCGCVGVGQQEDWLRKRAEAHGFQVGEEDFRVVGNDWHTFYKQETREREKAEKRVLLREATYEGVLTVTDVDKFKELLCNGLGRGKAYGMGLLTVMRLA